MERIISHHPASVSRNLLTPSELARVQPVLAQLQDLRVLAQIEVESGLASRTMRAVDRFYNTARTSRWYDAWRGKAVEAEWFRLIREEVRAGRLPGMATDKGVAVPEFGLTSSFGRLRPDVRMSLGAGDEAIFDLTTSARAGASPMGHAGARYGRFPFVRFIADIPY
jgi:hypothetical protein